MDLMLAFNRFGIEVAEALNSRGVKPQPDLLCACMIIVGSPAHGEPCGGSINFNDTTGKWELAVELSAVVKLDEEGG